MDTTNNIPGQNILLTCVKNIFSRTLRASGNVPQHIGFVMDGNRRYARKNNMEVKEGHEAGFYSMSKVLELCYEAGVNTATVYAFSIENFKRSSSEVNALMNLAKTRIRQITEHGELAHKYGIRVRIVGELSLLDEELLEEIKIATETTRNNTRATLNICFPYTGRQEIVHSMKEIISNSTDSSLIDEHLVEQHLYTGGLPPLDLLVRTSGVSRLSDFLIWQSSNRGVSVELLDCLWPELGPARMGGILLKYAFQKSFFQRSAKMEEEEEEEGIDEDLDITHEEEDLSFIKQSKDTISKTIPTNKKTKLQ